MDAFGASAPVTEVTMRFGSLLVGAGLLLAMPASADAPAMRESLLHAYEEDMNEHARYLAYARQAEGEGYHQAARVFRATAEAERVRAERHARALRRAGWEPRANLESPSVRSTRANLSRALLHERSERDEGYPRRGDRARREGDAETEHAFTLSRDAHEALVSLYREALRDLEAMRDVREELHVCLVCGHVAKGRAPHRCPISHVATEAFARVD